MANTYLQQSIGNGNRKTWTWSAWVKRSRLSTTQILADNYTDSSNYAHLYFNGSDNLVFYSPPAGTWSWHPVYRDTNAWYHIVLRCDTTLATNTDRVRLYVNEELQSANAVAGINQNQELNFNASSQLRFGARQVGTSDYFDGLIAHAHFTDGYSYAPTEFGETDSTTGIWKPKTSPSVSYGTNGYFLDFANSSDMGNDISGNNNDFTVSGGTMTQTIDTPSNVFATYNANVTQTAGTSGRHGSVSLSLANGNLSAGAGAAIYADQASTLGFTKGKYYAEFQTTGDTYTAMGIVNQKWIDTSLGTYVGSEATNGNNIGYQSVNGVVKKNNSTQYTGSTFTSANDIISIAVDMDNNYIYFAKNGVWQNSGVPTSGATGTGGVSIPEDEYFFAVSAHNNSGSGTQYVHANFGNGYFGTTAVASAGTNSGIGTFEYDVPSGFKALCTKNINAQEYS